jgi:hypothetical protein
MSEPDLVPTAAELRRYLRHASVLLATSDRGTPCDSLHTLDLAVHWLRVALSGIERLARHVEAIPTAVEEPLTGPIEIATMRIQR